MPKFFVNQEQVTEEKIKIIGNDVNHIKNVLREKVGNELTICNTNNMKDYLCEILKISEECIECKIKEELEKNVESNIKVTIMQGLPKADKMELIIQKSVELGAFDITPIEMKRCVVKLNEKDKQKKIQRWQKISEVAAKQCGRNIIPSINSILNLKNVCNLLEEYDIVLLAYENERENTLKQELNEIKQNYSEKEIKIAIIIGPEGGVAPEEVELLQKNRSKINYIRKKNIKDRNSSFKCFKCYNVRTRRLGGNNEKNI